MPVLTEKQADYGEKFGALMSTTTTKTYVPSASRGKQQEPLNPAVDVSAGFVDTSPSISDEQINKIRQDAKNKAALDARNNYVNKQKEQMSQAIKDRGDDEDGVVVRFNPQNDKYKGFNPTIENNPLPLLKANMEKLAPKTRGMMATLTYGDKESIKQANEANKEYVEGAMIQLLADSGYAIGEVHLDSIGNVWDRYHPTEAKPTKKGIRVLLPDKDGNYQYVDPFDDGDLIDKVSNWASTNAYDLALGLGADITTMAVLGNTLNTGSKVAKWGKATIAGAFVGTAVSGFAEKFDEQRALHTLAEYGLETYNAAASASKLEVWRDSFDKFVDYATIGGALYPVMPLIGKTANILAIKPSNWMYSKFFGESMGDTAKRGYNFSKRIMFGPDSVKPNQSVAEHSIALAEGESSKLLGKAKSGFNKINGKAKSGFDKINNKVEAAEAAENETAARLLAGEQIEDFSKYTNNNAFLGGPRRTIAKGMYKFGQTAIGKYMPMTNGLARAVDPDIKSRFFFSTMKSLPQHFELTGADPTYLANTREAMKNVGVYSDTMSESEALVTQLMMHSNKGSVLMQQVIAEGGTAGQTTAQNIKNAIIARNLQFKGFAEDLRKVNDEMVPDVTTLQNTKAHIEEFMVNHTNNANGFRKSIAEIVKNNHPTSGLIKSSLGNLDRLTEYKLKNTYTPKNLSIAQEYQDIVQSMLERKLPHKTHLPISTTKKEQTYSNRSDIEMFATTNSMKEPEYLSFEDILQMRYDLSSIANPNNRVEAFATTLDDIIMNTLKQSNIADKDLSNYVSMLNQTYVERGLINSFDHLPIYSKMFDGKLHNVDELKTNLYKTAQAVKITDNLADLNTLIKIVETKDKDTARQLHGLVLDSVFRDIQTGDKNYTKMDMVNLVDKLKNLHGYTSQEKEVVLTIAEAQAKFWVNESDIVKALKDVKVTKQSGPGLTKNLISKAQFETASKVFGYIKNMLSPELAYQQNRIIKKFIEATQNPMDANVVNAFKRLTKDAQSKKYPEIEQLAARLDEDFSMFSSLYNQQENIAKKFANEIDNMRNIDDAQRIAEEYIAMTRNALGVDTVSAPKVTGNNTTAIPTANKSEAYNAGVEALKGDMNDMQIYSNIFNSLESTQGVSYNREAVMNNIINDINKSSKRKIPEVNSNIIEKLRQTRANDGFKEGIDLDLSAQRWLQERNMNYSDTFENAVDETMAQTINMLHKQKADLSSENLATVLSGLESHFSNINSKYATKMLQNIVELKSKVNDPNYIRSILTQMEN